MAIDLSMDGLGILLFINSIDIFSESIDIFLPFL